MNLEDTSSHSSHSASDWFTDEHVLLDELKRASDQSSREVRIPSIPGYTDLMELSRGGQGIVYSGVQISTKRRVAIKVLLDKHNHSATARHRFTREIDLIASLKHPNIVRIYDSGVTEDDQLFFVMEFIEGESLDAYLDFAHMPPSLPDVLTESAADTKTVIDVFLRIATAVSHAHQRGVIHRDLKPSNIRIDSSGEPHVLDFGLAKIADELTDSESTVWRTETSQVGSFFGSLPWASPEQAEGEHRTIDVRSDVYSIGVMLYQALAGSFPYDMTGSMREILTRISNDEPRRDASIWRKYGADLETIVMTCLAKAPERRYQSAHELANDLQRLKANEPIMARPDSFAYRARKFIRRNRAMVAAASLLLLLLVGYGITMSFLYQKATTAEQLATEESKRATEEANRATAVNNFLEDMLASTDPKRAGYDVTVREVLDASSAHLNERFADQPLVRAALHDIIGNTYVGLGDYVSGASHWRDAYEDYRQVLGSDHIRTITAANNLATNLTLASQYEEALPIIEDLLERAPRVLGPDDPLTLDIRGSHALYLQSTEDYEAAEKELRDVHEALVDAVGERHVDTLDTLNNLALLLLNIGRYEESKELFEESMQLELDVYGREHPRTIASMMMLASALTELDELDRAEELLEESYELAHRVMGESHQSTIQAFSDRLNVQSMRGEIENVVPEVTRMLQSMQENLGPDHEQTLNMVNTLAVLNYRVGNLDEAARLLEELVTRSGEKYGKESVSTLYPWFNLIAVLRALDRIEEAESHISEALPYAKETYGEQHVDYAWALQNHGRILTDLERFDEAIATLKQAVAILRTQLPPEHSNVINILETYGKALYYAGQYDRAVEVLTGALDALGERDQPQQIRLMTLLAESETGRGNDEQAAQWQAIMADLQDESQPPDDDLQRDEE